MAWDTAIIVTSPGGRRGNGPCNDLPDPLLRLGGLPLLSRLVLTVHQAGLKARILMLGNPSSAVEDLVQRLRRDHDLTGLALDSLKAGHDGKGLVLPDSFLLLMANAIVDHRLLLPIRQQAVGPGEAILWVQRATPKTPPFPGLVKVRGEGGWVRAMGKGLEGAVGLSTDIYLCSRSFFTTVLLPLLVNRKGEEQPFHLDAGPGHLPLRETEAQAGWWHPVVCDLSRRAAERHLFRGLIKETDSFLTRWIDRRFSLAISRTLVNIPITPNQITAGSVLIGLLAALSLAQTSYQQRVFGSLLLLISSIIDGCDGEIARLKFQTSRRGALLDFLGDNLVHVAIFLGLGWGLYRSNPWQGYPILGGMAAAGVGCSVALVYRFTLNPARPGAESELHFVSVADPSHARAAARGVQSLIRVDDLLARRDFLYLVLLLALLNRLEWFLWAGALGANLFWLTLLVIYHARGELGITRRTRGKERGQ